MYCLAERTDTDTGNLFPATSHIPIPTIEEVEGGSVRCMIAEIFLEKK